MYNVELYRRSKNRLACSCMDGYSQLRRPRFVILPQPVDLEAATKEFGSR